MPGELDEPTLIRAARQGDLQAFNLLILHYQGLLFGIALRILGDEDSASDATQVAWISAFRRFNTFRCGSLRSWLVRVLVNACYDETRRRRRRREVPLLNLSIDGDGNELDCWLVDPAPGPEGRAETDEVEKTIERSLQLLASTYRCMLVLVDIEGLTYEEAAMAAGVPIGTVKSRLARARMRLRETLSALGFQ